MDHGWQPSVSPLGAHREAIEPFELTEEFFGQPLPLLYFSIGLARLGSVGMLGYDSLENHAHRDR